MSFISKRSLLERARRGKQARSRLVSSNLDKGIAFQIRATRSARDWTQVRLAQETGMSPNNVSRIESEDYGRQTITSLKRIADALDVALIVRFVPFSQYIDWLSGTPHLDHGIRPAALAVPSFEDEEEDKVFDTEVTYWPQIRGGKTNAQKDLWMSIEDGRIGVSTTHIKNSPLPPHSANENTVLQERAS